MLNVLWSCRDEIPLIQEMDLERFFEWVRDHCAHHRFFVVDVEHGIGGIMLVTPPQLGVAKGGVDELFYLAVRRECRRRGITRSLLAFAKARWPALHAIAYEQNKVIQAILEREGFHEKPSTSFHWRHYEWHSTPA